MISFIILLGSASSGNTALFPQNVTNYYSNVFNPNVNTQFLQNINPPSSNVNPSLQQQQQQYQAMSYDVIGIPVSIVDKTIQHD